MKVVIDSNRVLAAMLKDSTTRGILLDLFFEFVAPDFIISEVRKYEERVIKVADISKEEFEMILALIFESITILPRTEYREFIELLKDEIEDPKDLPYVAVCLASKAEGIWTHDPHFLEQHKVKVYTNIDMLKLSKKVKSDWS